MFKAINFAKKAHKGQKRKSGEDYIIHPVSIAKMLISLDVKQKTLIIALLHDVVENSHYTAKDIERLFNDHIAKCIKYLTKDYYPTKKERIIKYIQKLNKGIRYNKAIYLVKIADVLNNLKTINHLSENKQIEQLQEIKNYYLPFFKKNLTLIKKKHQQPCKIFIEKIENNILRRIS